VGAFEKEINSATGITEYKYYVSAGGRTVAMIIDRSNSTTDWRYPHQDHLGSTVAVTNAAGQLLERYEYDAWGKRRNTDGTPSASQIVGATDRGYTGHEMLDSLGLIHMNGRVYDASLARFISADPFIQHPDNLASYNRYSYVYNTPLSATDPSGYFLKWLERKVRREYKRSELFRAALGIGVGWLTGFGVNALLSEAAGITGSLAFATEIGVASGAAGGFAGSLVASGGDLKAAAQGALTGGAFGFVGASWAGGSIENYAGHAVVGCASAAMGGGNCARGAASQVISKWVTVETDRWHPAAQMAAATVAGGTTSVITGGKFANGAQTAAFGYLFNAALTRLRNQLVQGMGYRKDAAISDEQLLKDMKSTGTTVLKEGTVKALGAVSVTADVVTFVAPETAPIAQPIGTAADLGKAAITGDYESLFPNLVAALVERGLKWVSYGVKGVEAAITRFSVMVNQTLQNAEPPKP
jgi:RHS repeat-associated protein